MMRILVSVLSLVLCGTLAAEGAIVLDKVVAVVNKEVITWSEVYKQMEFEGGAELASKSDEEKKTIFAKSEQAFLELLIDLRLQLQEAARVNIKVTDEDTSRALDGIRQKSRMSPEDFAAALRKEGFTAEEYKKRLAEQMTITRVVDQEVRGKLVVTDREVDEYLAANPHIVKESEGYVLSAIFLKPGEDRAATEQKASDIFLQLKTGGDFAALARQHSEDRTAAAGGDLGFVKKDDLSKDFLSVLSKMAAGEVSQPFWTERGMYLLRLNEVRNAKTQQELRAATREKMLDERFVKEYKGWVKGLREKAYVEVK